MLSTSPRPTTKQLWGLKSNGDLELYPHRGQWRVWQSRARYVAMIAGFQSGKTSFGPHWLHREILNQGPGDYLAVTATFPLL